MQKVANELATLISSLNLRNEEMYVRNEEMYVEEYVWYRSP